MQPCRVPLEATRARRQELATLSPAFAVRRSAAGSRRDNQRVSSDSSFRPRRLSCGIVIVSDTRELLLCHVTGQRHWDLPKGGIHDGETPRQAALRETAEETGLVLVAEALSDLGRFSYTAKKDLHLFAALLERVDPGGLCCESTFVERGSRRTLPEMDAFGWFAFDRVAELCTPRMAALLVDNVGLAATLDTVLGLASHRLAA
jgi:8-oxo-dGTP pyrophosphatase MutT (NUDIX family)